MRQLQRFPALAGSLLGRLRAPEGDPFSVEAMASVCWMLPELLLPSGILFRSYVDNWSWVATSKQQLVVSIPETLHFLLSIHMPIDWDKSYAWAATHTLRVWWQQSGQHFIPAGVPLKVVTEVKELGILTLLGVGPPQACVLAYD